MLRTPADCHRFIEHHSPASIASFLREDQRRCHVKQVPSLLSLYLPSSSSVLGEEIARHLSYVGVPSSVRRLQYDGIINIKAYLNQMERDPNEGKSTTKTPTAKEFHSTLKVLDYLQSPALSEPISDATPLSDIIAALNTEMGISPGLRSALLSDSAVSDPNATRKCYICRRKFRRRESQYLYRTLCRPCGYFNLDASELSLPPKLDLFGKTALVTGGRVNLGFHTAVRLLRCGANVIVSSRYPRDAARRLSSASDSAMWLSRLQVVGADFRTAADAFQLVTAVKDLLEKWAMSPLHVLINNAAQTLTDPVKAELKAIAQEGQLQDDLDPAAKGLLSNPGYEPRVRGGTAAGWAAGIGDHAMPLMENEGTNDPGYRAGERTHNGLQHGNDEETISKSSWTQKITEIPYDDIISAFSVNTFVPLILCRELRAHMGDISNNRRNGRASAYIINVSSREGILEDESPKKDHHVHTNMTKAAMNMITETDSRDMWEQKRIAMNTVDPGFMSAAPECQPQDGCPIGFDDGAARVLWPIARSKQDDGMVIRGQSLKHFGEAVATVRRG